jgi:general secretion pathway protein A
MVGSETRTVDAKEISKRWYGDYMLLWQAPPGYRAKILPGSRGPDVQWIERQLAFTQGRADKTGQDTMYGEDLIRQVKKFQLEKGLVPDGVAGAQTIIHLNNAVGSSEPRLSEKRGAG